MSSPDPLKAKEESLYARSWSEDEVRRARPSREIVLPHSWNAGGSIPIVEPRSSSSIGFIFFICSLLFCLGAGGFLYFQIMMNKNAVESEKIGIELVVDQYVDGGQEEELYVMVSNKNNISLNDARITISYEAGIGMNNENKTTKIEVPLGTLLPNSVKKEKITFTLYGREKEKRTLGVRFDYTIDGSSAVFTKDTATDVFLKSPPVSITIVGNEEILNEQRETYTVTLKNTTASTSAKLLVVVNAPSSFTLTQTSIPNNNKTLSWNINPLSGGEEKTFTFQGYVEASVGESLTMNALVGLPQGSSGAPDPVFALDQKTLTIKEPGIKLNLIAETDRGESKVLRYGDKVTARMRYSNTGSTTLEDVRLVAYIKADAIDPSSVFVDGRGYFDSNAGSIMWTPASLTTLRGLPPGAQGEVTFSFTVPKVASISSVAIDIDGRGNSLLTGNISRTASTVTLRLQGGASLSGYTTYKAGSISNTGPMPPKANQDTTLSAVLTASSQAKISRAKVVFSLPAYVEWAGESIPNTLSYDSRTKEVTWMIGDMESEIPQKAEVKLRVRPSLTHVGTAPAITSGILFQGTDLSTGLPVEDVLPQLTTAIQEPGATEKSGIVTR